MNRFEIQEAMTRLGRRYPEYLYELSKIRIYKAVPGMLEQSGGPMGVDEYWRLYYDPDVDVTGKDAKHRMETLLLHELGHLNGNDAERAREFEQGHSVVVEMMGMNPAKQAGEVNPLVWNLAGDARINAELRKLPWAKTENLVFPETLNPQWDDRTTGKIMPPEWYYMKIRESAKPGGEGIPIPPPDWQKSDGSGDGKGQGGQGQGDQQGQGGQPQDGDGQGHSCGSIAGGGPKPWEDAPDEECMTADERKAVVEETERKIAQKMVNGEKLGGRDPQDQSGTGIGHEALFPMLCDPEKIRSHYNHALWLDTMQRALYKHLEQAKRTFMMPHRRIEGLPGKRRFPKQAVIVCDISGSINELSVIRTFELLERLYGRGFDIKIVACDTQAHVVTDRKARYSGGGTDMAEGVRFAAERFPRAGLIVVVTDGGTGWQDEKPTSIPVVVMSWAQIGPEWAENIPMPGLTDDYPVKPDWENGRYRRRR